MLHIAICDDENKIREDITGTVRNYFEGVRITQFGNGHNLLESFNRQSFDMVLLDIDMPEMNGITLAARIKQIKPDTVILFLTAYKEYAFDAFQVHPSGYLLKPVLPELLQKEIDHAMSAHPKAEILHIEARTFGNFELFVDGEPVAFKRSKSKELLAYLIDRRGMSVTRAEISAVLFEDAPYDHSRQKYLDAIIRSLRDTLREHGIENIMQMERKGIRIIPEKLNCDMYRFYEGDTEVIKAFRGEYLESYTWANFVEADMRSKTEKL